MYLFCVSNKVPTNDCFADQLLGKYALQLSFTAVL